MQTEFTYRELSEKLDINLAKLKRWGREFLPPDGTAGQQQGVARVLTIDEAFVLFLARKLLSALKYSIPETKEIMELLLPWLRTKKLMPSLLSECDTANIHWMLDIRYLVNLNEFSCTAKTLTKKVYSEEKKESFQNSLVLRRRLEEHSIVEIIIPDKHKQEFDKFYYDYTEKTISVFLLLMSFLAPLGEIESFKQKYMKDLDTPRSIYM